MKSLLLGFVLLFVGAPAFAAPAARPAVEKRQAVVLRYTKHARQRMAERGVSPEEVFGIVDTVTPFKYYRQGKWKTGYYDPDKKIFVAADGPVVITVITGATSYYVAGLKRKKP